MAIEHRETAEGFFNLKEFLISLIALSPEITRKEEEVFTLKPLLLAV